MRKDAIYGEDLCDEYWARLSRAISSDRFTVKRRVSQYQAKEDQGNPVGRRYTGAQRITPRVKGEFNYIDRPFKGRNVA